MNPIAPGAILGVIGSLAWGLITGHSEAFAAAFMCMAAVWFFEWHRKSLEEDAEAYREEQEIERLVALNAKYNDGYGEGEQARQQIEALVRRKRG